MTQKLKNQFINTDKQKRMVRIFAIAVFALVLLLLIVYFFLLPRYGSGLYPYFDSNITFENQATWIIIFGFTVLILILFLSGFFFKNTGFIDYTDQNNHRRVRTLWDWVNLLVIPLMLAAGGFLYTAHQNYISTQTARNQEDFSMMKDYFTDMSKLILDQKLLDPQQRSIQNSPQTQLLFSMAEARTIAVINSLQDIKKKSEVMRFLSESTLIQPQIVSSHKNFPPKSFPPLITLRRVDLSHVDLSGLNLAQVSLIDSDLQEAILSKTILNLAILRGSRLDGAQLNNAEMQGADLADTHLDHATLDYADMRDTKLSGATFAHASLKETHLRRAKNMKNITDSDDVQFDHTEMPDGTYRYSSRSVHPIRVKLRMDEVNNELAWQGHRGEVFTTKN